MHYWMFYMRGDSPAPSNSGDWKSWFLYYRWNKDEQVYLPLSCAEVMLLEHKSQVPQEGDALWLVLDRDVYGMATIQRLIEDNGSARWELWYDAAKVRAVPEKDRQVGTMPPFHLGWSLSVLTEEEHKRWLEKIR